jgi:hypothetical protein
MHDVTGLKSSDHVCLRTNIFIIIIITNNIIDTSNTTDDNNEYKRRPFCARAIGEFVRRV